MFRLVDVDVVFDDFESEHLLGKWYVDFGQVAGFGSKKGLTEHLIRAYKKQGKKVMYLTVWPIEKWLPSKLWVLKSTLNQRG